jgi:bifunctional non-homologous end joining protein LigD
MLATLARQLPRDDGHWAYEFKWDGVRALVFVADGQVRVQGRSRRDFTGQYPEVTGLGAALAAAGTRDVVLDGEVVALGPDGTPSFQTLQRRMHVVSPHDVRVRMGDTPVIFLAFDVLRLDGNVTLELPYTERRARLEELDLSANNWQTTPSQAGDGESVLAVSRERGLEGVVAKRLDSPYEPGRRSRSWLKIKNKRREQLVIGGWAEGSGNRTGRIGALLVGYYDAGTDDDADDEHRLRFAGRVGTGFSDTELRRLHDMFVSLERATSPFDPPPPHKAAHYLEPRLVAEVEFTEWTSAGIIRHPVYKGLRDDTDPSEVVRETVG